MRKYGNRKGIQSEIQYSPCPVQYAYTGKRVARSIHVNGYRLNRRWYLFTEAFFTVFA